MIDKEKQHAFWKETRETVIFVVIAVIIIRFFIAELRYIPSGSMLPTLVGAENFKGDRIVVEKITKFPNIIKTHRFESTPKRGDIMIFYPPFIEMKTSLWRHFCRLTGLLCNERDTAYIKRVVGLPGEKFEIAKNEDGKFSILINDKPLKEDYIMSEYDYPRCSQDMFCGPFIIPEDHYFMMGDNRGNSIDSRYWGPLKKERFIGRAVCVFFPFNRAKILN